VGKISATPENAGQTNLVISELEKQVESVKEGTIEPTAAITEKPTTTTSINIAEPQPITEEELPAIEEGLPPIETEQPKGLLGRISQISSNLKTQEKEPSAYEGYKKLLEEISGGQVIGQGEEAFILTPEMQKEAEKASEFIGPEKGVPKKIESTRSITPPTKEELVEKEKKLEIESYDKKYNEINNEIKNFKKEKIGIGGVDREEDMGKDDLDTLESMRKRRDKYEEMSDSLDMGEVESFNKKIETKGLTKEMELAPIKPTLSQIPIPEEEEKTTLGEKLKSGVGKIKDKFKKEEKIEPEAATAQGEQPKYVVKDAEGNILSESIDKEVARKKSGIAGLGIEPELVATPTTEIPTTEVKEEKQSLGKRLKEGIGNITEKLKKEKVEEPPVTEAIPETQEEFIVRDTEGKELARSIDRETAEKKAGTSEGITVSKETTPITPSVPETPSVGIEKIVAEKSEEPKTLREKIGEGADKLGRGVEKFAGKIGEKFDGGKLKEKIEEVKGKIKGEEELPKTEPIAPESKSQSIFNDEERNRLLSEVDESGNPLYRERQDKSLVYLPEERKSQEEDKVIDSLFNEKSKIKKSSSSPFGLDMKMFEQKLPEVPKASLETEESVPMGVSLTSLVEEEESITEPTSITQLAEKEEGIIEPVTIEPEEPKETEIQTALREAREKQLSYLEELRQKEQIETPSRGIEKIAKIGGRLGEIGKGLFGKPEVQEEIQQYEIPNEAEYEYTPTDEMGKFDISNLKQEYLGPEEIEAPEAPEIGIPEIPTPQGIDEQVFGGQTPQTGGEGSTQTINVNAKIEITGNPEFAKLLDPRKLQSTVESIFVTSMTQKTNVAQKVNASSQESGMGISSYSSSLDQ
jgi:hypothetical protein